MCETVLCLKKPKKKEWLWPSLCFTVPPFSTGNICLCFAIFTVCRRALCAPFGQRRGHVVKFVIACEGRQINSDTLAFSPEWEVQNVTFHSWRPVSGRLGYYWVESGVSLAPASFNVCPLYGYLPKNICTRFALSVHFALAENMSKINENTTFQYRTKTAADSLLWETIHTEIQSCKSFKPTYCSFPASLSG